MNVSSTSQDAPTAQHIPGPWHVARAIFEEETKEVAYILDGVSQADAPTARLIAAAPDLLAALEAVEWAADVALEHGGTALGCPWCDQPREDGHYPACQLSAALKKARGGE